MKVIHSFSLTVVTVASLLGPGVAYAEMYKWTDDEGNIIYSQTPPPGRTATTIAPPPPPPRAAANEGSEGEAEAKSSEDPTVKARTEFERITQQNCEIAKQNLEIYKTFTRISNEKGEVTVLDEETRAAHIKREEKNVKTFCK